MTKQATGRTANTSSTYTPAPDHRFDVGDPVVIKRSFPPGHRRTPCYIRGKTGVIERICGMFPNPEERAYGFDGRPAKVLYRVRFPQIKVWPNYAGSDKDVIEMEIFEHWLESADKSPERPELNEIG